MKRIMKRLPVLLLALALLFAFSVCAAASGEIPAERQKPLLVDDADLLSPDEEAALLPLLEEKSAAVGADIAVVTVNDTDGQDVENFAYDYYDYNGYGQGEENDGVLLLISMAERDYWIVTTGYCIEAITDYGLEKIQNDFLPSLSYGNYIDAFRTFAADCETLIAAARQGNVYDLYHSEDDPENTYGGYYNDASNYYDGESYLPQNYHPFNVGANALLALVIGFVLALITVLSMKGKLQTVRRRYEASNYVVPGSLALRANDDRFLYSTVSQTAIPQHTEDHSSHGGGFSGGGSHTSFGSSGVSHGGGGGKF
ncbi:MAG: TPM domain-containing protein [Clostridia bacterium]|nr:TPM domain-containing protein [Clostridia bacterium]